MVTPIKHSAIILVLLLAALPAMAFPFLPFRRAVAATTYTVAYDANGGTGTMTDASSPYASGATVTVKNNEFTYADHHFDHWNTAANDSGTTYAPAATFTIAANTTLYAQWHHDPTNATYYPNSLNCTAYYGSVADGTNDADPPGALADYATELSAGELDDISVDDADFHHAAASFKMGHRMKIKITQTPANISKIKITTKGWGARFVFTYGQWLHVYDVTNSHWDAAIDTHAETSSHEMEVEITSGITGFIDASGYFNYLTHSPKAISSNTWDDIYFTKIVVTYTP